MENQQPSHKTISILGCGWYGMALAKTLLKDGYVVKGSSTSEERLPLLTAEGIAAFKVVFEHDKSIYPPSFFDCEVLVISIPPGRQSPHLLHYANKIKNISAAAEKHQVKQIIFISSTGVFADSNELIDESKIPNPTSDSGKMMWEAEQLLMANSSFQTTVIRFAGLIGEDRNLTKHFAGKTEIANGLAPVNLIHQTDCVGLTKAIIAQGTDGKTYHGVTPDHPTRQDFYTKNCKVHGLPVPQFVPELLTWKQIESINIRQLGYDYQIKKWEDWLENVLIR